MLQGRRLERRKFAEAEVEWGHFVLPSYSAKEHLTKKTNIAKKRTGFIDDLRRDGEKYGIANFSDPLTPLWWTKVNWRLKDLQRRNQLRILHITVAKPTEKHLHAVKRIFRYLKGTIDMGLWYSKDSCITLTAYADADHVGEEADNKEESVSEEENVDEENAEESDDDDKSFDITNTDDERMESDSSDHGIAKEGKTVAKIEEEETTNSEHEEDDTKGDDQKTEDEPKGDDRAKEAEVGVPDLVTNKEKSEFLQSTSSHLISLNFGNQFLVNYPNASLIGTIPKNADKEITSSMDIEIQQDEPLVQNEPFYEVKVSVIPEPT
ncbi:hypothetical protein Tco_0121739 [Tanacetum coccineum]